MDKLLLHEQVLLLAIHDGNGTFSSGMYLYSVAGGLISELLLQERMVASDDKKQIVAVVNDKPVGESLLDELLVQIGDTKKNHGLRHWVFQAAKIPKLRHRVAEGLCDKGILKSDERKVLWLFTQKIYPELDRAWEDSIRREMGKIMFRPGVLPDARMGVLISLAGHANLLTANFPSEELTQHKQRIKELVNGEILAAGATKSAIQAVRAAITVATMVPVITASATH